MYRSSFHGRRHRRVPALGAAVVLAAAVLLTGPASGAEDAAGTAAEPAVSVGSVTELGKITENENIDYDAPFFSGRDNGQSTGYDGKSVWIFNDTGVRNTSELPSNTAAMTDDMDASDGLDLTSASPFTPDDNGVPGPVIPKTGGEQAFLDAHGGDCSVDEDEYCGSQFAWWPGAIVADPARDRLLTFYGKLCRGQDAGRPCASDFIGQGQGSGVAELDMNTGTVTRLEAKNLPEPIPSVEGDDATLLFKPGEEYGNGSSVVQGDTLYAYGRCGDDGGCRLARVPLGSVEDRATWEFYAGTENGAALWSADESEAVGTGKRDGAAGSTVHRNEGLGTWINTYMNPLSNTASYQTAPNPWGPWSEPGKLFDSQPPEEGVNYALYAHPELAQNNGRTQYLTYYQPGTGHQRLVRVDFETH